MSYTYIIICIILLIVPDIYYYMTPKLVFEIDSIKFRTGDLFLTRWQSEPLLSYNSKTKTRTFRIDSLLYTIYNNITSAMSRMGFTYTHSGVCIMIDNEPYIYECNNITHYTIDKIDHIYKKIIINTPSLLPLSYINNYRGHVYHYPYAGSDLNMNQVFKFIDTHKNNELLNISNINVDDLKFMYNNPNTLRKNTCASLISKFISDFIRIPQTVHIATPRNIINDCIQAGSHLNEPHLLKNNFSIYHQ